MPLPPGIGRPDVATDRTLEPSVAWPRITAYCAGACQMQHSTSEPCSFWLIGSSVINVLPLKAQVKHRITGSPTHHYPLEFEITFCVRGVITPPWGTPFFPVAFRIILSKDIPPSSCPRRATFSNSRECCTLSK